MRLNNKYIKLHKLELYITGIQYMAAGQVCVSWLHELTPPLAPPRQVELFRELQLLKTDYLRQRALYSVQELVTKFLTEEGVAQEAMAAKVAIYHSDVL